LQLKNIQKKPPFTLMSYHILCHQFKRCYDGAGYVHTDRLWQMELMRRIAPEDYLKFLVQ
jgi:hypothetical protein